MRQLFFAKERSPRSWRLARLLLSIGACLGCAISIGLAGLPAVPSRLILTVRETAGIARAAELVRTGVPLPRSLGVRDTGTLTLVDAADLPVPAEFEALARWNAPRSDATASIQWLLVTFHATVAAGGSAAYRVVTDGSSGPNPGPAVSVKLTRSGDRVTVDTGAATFVVGGSAAALFDEVRLPSGTRLVRGGALTATANGAEATHPTTRSVTIEHAGPLVAIVTVRGAYSMANLGDGALGSFRRYVFAAGSPTAIVRHAVEWEGSLCGDGIVECNGAPNAVRLRRVRDSLLLDLTPPLRATAVGSFSAAAAAADVAAGQEASVRQLLRANRTSPLAFSVTVPGTTVTRGVQADGGILSVGAGSGAVAVGLARMHRYEPQALRLLADGSLAVDVADDQVWLGARQGLFATLAVGALAASPSRAELDRQVWAPLNHPLQGLAEPEWFAASEAIDELPVGTLPANLSAYATLLDEALRATLEMLDDKGMAGLMTFGLYPRYWGSPLYSDELDCAGDDPTPTESWDDTYWCATWTDYHSTTSSAALQAMRRRDAAWLDEIAFPAALRMLHTQIMQCSAGDPYFYCGQAPAGYGGYRENFNSSHAYFDNLFLYYWLTGDATVVDTLQRGARSMRDYLCTRRPGSPCLPDDRPTDEWAGLTGRVASQWFAAFRFVGLASDDGSYLDDYRSGLARAVTQYFVEAKQGGVSYGFLSSDPVDGPGTDTTDQLWMASLYDMNMLYRLRVDTGDAPIGNPAIAPSRVLAGWARTLAHFGSTVSGDGTASGRWPNQLDFTWSGDRIGGTLVSARANPGGGDPLLYDTGKATLTAVMLRAADQTGESELERVGSDLTAYTLAAAAREPSPLGKIHGEYFARLHAAVARLSRAALGPTVAITMSKSLYVEGDTVSATEFRIRNSGGNTPIGLRVWLQVPGVGAVDLLSIGSDGSFQLPGAIDVNLGPLSLFLVSAAFPPKGSWELNSRITSPSSGAVLGEDLNPFTIQ